MKSSPELRLDVVSMEGAGDGEPPPPKSTRAPLGESTNGQNDRTATRSSSGFAEPGEVAGEASNEGLSGVSTMTTST